MERLILISSAIGQVVVPFSITAWVLVISFSPSDITNMTGAIAILVAAIFVGIVNVIAAQAAAKKAIAPIVTKIDVIEGHVNSAATKAQGVIDGQKIQIDQQREIIAKLEQQAALIAQSVAQAQVYKTAAELGAADTGTAEASLEQIDTNTAAIEKNTASTDAKVDDLKDKA